MVRFGVQRNGTGTAGRGHRFYYPELARLLLKIEELLKKFPPKA